jgi:hypothetical protein
MMNFIALIGFIKEISNLDDNAIIHLKVEKNCTFKSNNNYEIIDINVDKIIFKKELEILKLGTLIGIKGRLDTFKNKLHLICERMQIF